RAERLFDFAMRSRETFRVACVGGKKLRLAVFFNDAFYAGFAALAIAPEHRDARACVGESFSECAAEHAGGADHDRNLAGKIEKCRHFTPPKSGEVFIMRRYAKGTAGQSRKITDSTMVAAVC